MTDEFFTPEGARSSAQERETPRHDVTVRQASLLFAEFGVPRSPRSVQGFCKDGHLDCVAVKGPNGDRYLINRESIERYATELKQIDEVAKIGAEDSSALLRAKARESAQERAPQQEEGSQGDTTTETLKDDPQDAIQKLREENLNLRVDNFAKEKFINYLAGENRHLVAVVQDVSHKLGASETLVRQLEAPKEPVRTSAQERDNAAQSVIGTETTAPTDAEQQPAPAAAVDTKPEASPASVTQEPPRSFWRRIFG